MKKEIKVLVSFSEGDRKILERSKSYDFTWDTLMRQDFVLPINDATRLAIIKAVKRELLIVDKNILSDYRVIFREGKLLVLPNESN